MILSYLEGKTNEEVAALLRWPVGTVKGRLSRARDLLRSRLMRRGLALSAAFLMTALSQGTVFAEVVPAELVRRTVRLAGRVRSLNRPSIRPEPRPPALDRAQRHHVQRSARWFEARVGTGSRGGTSACWCWRSLSFSIATGIWITMLIPGGFSRAQAAVLSVTSGGTAASPPGSMTVMRP